MVPTPNDSNSSSNTPTTPGQLRDHLLASPQEAGYLCQYCSKRFLTLQGLGGHQQDIHQTELNLLSAEEPRRPLNLEERVQALRGAIMRAQRHVLQSSTRRAMAPGDDSSSSSYNVGTEDDGGGEDDYIITLPNFFGSNVTPRPHAYGFGAGDETPTEVLPPDSSNGGRLVHVGFCLNHLVRESYLMYPPPGFEPLMGESSAGANVGAEESENEGEVEGDGDGNEEDGNEKPFHEQLDVTLKL